MNSAGDTVADTMLRWSLEDECGQDLNGWIYWIGCKEPLSIKIGFTTKDPKLRLKQIQTGNPTELKLLGWYPGSLEQERLIHEKLADYRLTGEWFRIDPAMTELLRPEFMAMMINNALTGHMADEYERMAEDCRAETGGCVQ